MTCKNYISPLLKGDGFLIIGAPFLSFLHLWEASLLSGSITIWIRTTTAMRIAKQRGNQSDMDDLLVIEGRKGKERDICLYYSSSDYKIPFLFVEAKL